MISCQTVFHLVREKLDLFKEQAESLLQEYEALAQALRAENNLSLRSELYLTQIPEILKKQRDLTMFVLPEVCYELETSSILLVLGRSVDKLPCARNPVCNFQCKAFEELTQSIFGFTIEPDGFFNDRLFESFEKIQRLLTNQEEK